MKQVDYSYVIPCYRSEKTIQAVVDEIEETMRTRSELSYEIILVNDGSPDHVWDVIKQMNSEYKHVIGINLSKNFGQHCALMAGYHQAKGEYIISLDDDGQTPANEVFSLIDKLDEGYDVVYATYPEYHQSAFRKWGSDFANIMTAFMLDVKEKLPKGSSFYIMRRFICKEIIKYDNPYPYLGGLVLRSTRNIAVVPVQHRERISGKSGYSLKSLISLWMNGFTAFSVKPLEIGALIGMLFAIIGFVLALFVIVRKILYPGIQAGWSSTIAAMMVIGGILMIMLGLIGEYIGRIYICLNKSPQFIVKEMLSENDSSGYEER